MHRARTFLFSCALVFASAIGLNAQTFVWSGQSTANGNASDPTNWQGNVAPLGSTGLEDLVFDDISGAQQVAQIPTSAFHNISFTGTNRPEYSFTGSSSSMTLTGNLTANAGSPNGSSVDFGSTLGIILSDAINAVHTVDIAQTIVHVNGVVSESGAPASIIKEGTGTLYVSGYNTYTGGTTINNGTIIAASSYNALGSGAITVNSGGTLQLNYANLSTPTFNSGSRLTGQGYINDTTIGAGVTMAPGMGDDGTNAIGSLSFQDLTIGGNSTFEMNVRYNSEGYDYDQIFVYNSATLTINATANNPFTLKLISLNSGFGVGELGGSLLLGSTYELDFLSTNGISGDFILGQNLLLDTSSFDLGGVDATFDLIRNGNNYKLTFTPVPEPSTYALMALGLGFIGVTAWRRRRAS